MNILSETTVKKIEALLGDGYSVRAVAKALKLHRDTCAKYARQSLAKCQCGKARNHPGACGMRYLKSAVHKELLAKIHTDYVEPIRPKRVIRSVVRRTHYPYCIGPAGEGNALLRAVDDAVSKAIYDQDRCDICQDLIVYVLGGEITTADLTRSSKTATKAHNAMFSPKFGDWSLDAKVSGQDDESLKLLDIIPEGTTFLDAVPYGSSREFRKVTKQGLLA